MTRMKPCRTAVTYLDRLGEEAAHAVPGEHGLGQDCTTEEQTCRQSDDRHDRQEGVAQNMAPGDRPLQQPLRLSRPDVVLVDHVQDTCPGDPDDDRQEIDPRAIAGSSRCRIASHVAGRFPVIRPSRT